MVEGFNEHIYLEELVLKTENGGSHTDFLDFNLDISNERLFKKLFRKCDNLLSLLYTCYIYRNNYHLYSITNNLFDCTENQERWETKGRWVEGEDWQKLFIQILHNFLSDISLRRRVTKAMVQEMRLKKFTWILSKIIFRIFLPKTFFSYFNKLLR